MVKKVLKRKAENEKVENESYQAGGLSSLFGKSAEGAVIEENIVKGETVIEKPKRRKFVPKEKEEKNEEENNDDVSENNKDGEKKEGEEGTKRDRTKQRENRVKQKSNARSAAEENKKTLFVGNMPLTMNEKAVRRIFSDYGTIESVRMRGLIPTSEKLTKRLTHLTGKLHEKQNSLMFYIKFADSESVDKALTYNGTQLEDHAIRVDRCGAKKEFGKDLAIFVGNLSFDSTEDQLFKVFEENIGPVDSVRIVRDNTTGKGKGFAFVNFKHDSSASLALSMETVKMGERDLRITKVMKKGQLNKIDVAKKRNYGAAKKNKEEQKIEGKLKNFKFSTKKERSDEQNERRKLKKSAKKAIKKKVNAKKGRLMQ